MLSQSTITSHVETFSLVETVLYLKIKFLLNDTLQHCAKIGIQMHDFMVNSQAIYQLQELRCSHL